MILEKDETPSYRSVTTGASNVGKTSLVARYHKNSFSPSIPNTIGVSYSDLKIWDPRVNIQMYDTAGEEQFRSLAPVYFRGAKGALLVFDVTNRKSFDEIRVWHEVLQNIVGDNVVMILVGNKCDSAVRAVTKEDGQKLAETFKCDYMETSAKDGYNVEQLFQKLGTKLLERFGNKPDDNVLNNRQHEVNQRRDYCSYC